MFSYILEDRKRPARRYDTDHANLSMPDEIVEFINAWLASPKAKAAGIKSRRDLTITLLEIMLQKIARMDPKMRAKKPWHHRNDTLSRELFNRIAESVDQLYITKALWLPQSSSMLAFALSHFLMDQDKNYAELVKSLKVSYDDIQKFKRIRAN